MIDSQSALLTDLYQLTMLEGYWRGQMRGEAVFECYVRSLPKERSFLMAAGLEEVLSYLESFLFRFHHPKEDAYLFPKLLQRAPELAPVLEQLEQEHDRGAALIQEMREALTAYREGGPFGFRAFRDVALEYRELERRHMRTEESEVLLTADRVLTTEDWAELDAIFTAHDDPVFGDRPQAEFGQLVSVIVNRAPAPHGLGEAHG